MRTRYHLVFPAALLLLPASLPARVETYRYADVVPRSERFEVKVDGEVQTVFTTEEPDVCCFGCDGPVTVQVRLQGAPADSVAVRPLSIDFSQAWDGQTLTLTLSPKDRAVVEFDGDTARPLFLFANAIDPCKPSPKDKDVVYYKAGSLCNARNLNLEPGQTLYLEGGAWLMGNLRLEGSRQVRVKGAGILDARGTDGVAFRITDCDGVDVEGITLLNSAGHTTRIYGSRNLRIDNYKVVATRNPRQRKGLENDALNLISSSHAEVRRCFTYCHDDTYCIKTTEDGPAEDIHYEDCISWNNMGGNSFEIGYETTGDIRNVTYRRMYAIHKRDNPTLVRSADIGIHHASCGTIEDITYEDIYLEETDNWTLALMMFQNPYSKKAYAVNWVPGHIRNILFRDIHVLYPMEKGSRIEGADEDHRIENLVIDGLYVQGKRMHSCEEAGIRTAHAEVIFQ